MKNSTVSMYSKSFLEITETIIKTLNHENIKNPRGKLQTPSETLRNDSM